MSRNDGRDVEVARRECRSRAAGFVRVIGNVAKESLAQATPESSPVAMQSCQRDGYGTVKTIVRETRDWASVPATGRSPRDPRCPTRAERSVGRA